MKKLFVTVSGLVLALTSLPSSALAAPEHSAEPSARSTMRDGVAAVRAFRAEHGRLPGNARGTRVVKQKGNGIVERYGRVGSRNEFCVGAGPRGAEKTWYFDSVRGEAGHLSAQDLRTTPGACRSMMRLGARQARSSSDAKNVAVAIETYYVEHEKAPTAIGPRWRSANGVTLSKGSRVRAYETAAADDAYRYCIVATRGGYAYYDSTIGTVTSTGYGRECHL